jgi:hypothetical protein
MDRNRWGGVHVPGYAVVRDRPDHEAAGRIPKSEMGKSN